MRAVTDSPPTPHVSESTHPDLEARRQAARDDYRTSLADGIRLTGADLARRHGMSERWGRDRAAEARAHADSTMPAAPGVGTATGDGSRPALTPPAEGNGSRPANGGRPPAATGAADGRAGLPALPNAGKQDGSRRPAQTAPATGNGSTTVPAPPVAGSPNGNGTPSASDGGNGNDPTCRQGPATGANGDDPRPVAAMPATGSDNPSAGTTNTGTSGKSQATNSAAGPRPRGTGSPAQRHAPNGVLAVAGDRPHAPVTGNGTPAGSTASGMPNGNGHSTDLSGKPAGLANGNRHHSTAAVPASMAASGNHSGMPNGNGHNTNLSCRSAGPNNGNRHEGTTAVPAGPLPDAGANYVRDVGCQSDRLVGERRRDSTVASDAVAADPSRPAAGSIAQRRVTTAAVIVVALVAGAASYDHQRALAELAGEGWRSLLFPLSVDGLLTAATMLMLTRRRASQRAGALTWIALTLGVTVSVTGNVIGADPTIVDPVLVGRLVAAWPPVALFLSLELLMRQLGLRHEGHQR